MNRVLKFASIVLAIVDVYKRQEHACVRCPMLRPDPTARPRLVEIADNLRARTDEARREDWLGEVAGLEITLAATARKLDEMDQLAAHRSTVVNLGLPGPPRR